MTSFEVRRADILHNVRAVLDRAGVPVWGVLKYDGYGVGLEAMAEILREGGITRFAVSSAAELHRLRSAGFSEDTLILSPQSSRGEILLGITDRAIFSVGSEPYMDELIECARRMGRPLRAHIAVDTGMGRFGFPVSEHETIKRQYLRGGVSVEGIYSHFSSACTSRRRSLRQFELFTGLTDRLRADGIDCGMTHMANSPALFAYTGFELDAVRVGSALLGRVAGTDVRETGLARAGRLVTTVCELRTAARGQRCGYNGEFTARRKTELAVLAAGTREGIPLPSRRDVLLRRIPTAQVNGRAARIILAQSFGHVMLDVTGLGVRPGDKVEIDVNPLRVDSGVERVMI